MGAMMTGHDQPGVSQALQEARSRSAAEIRRLYEPYYEQLLRLNSLTRESIERRDSPENVYRWLVELDCGCITDALTTGYSAAHVPMEELRPADCIFQRMLGSRESGMSTDNILLFGWKVSWKYSARQEGYAWCSGHSDTKPFREIVEWVERKDRPRYYSDRLKKDIGPYASWVVRLSCGHYAHSVVTDVDWRPEHGHAVQADFVAKIRQRLGSEEIGDETRELLEWQLALQGTEPQEREECPDCAYTRAIVGCRPIGPLARPKSPSRPPSHSALTRRLNAAEANIGRLREQLAQAEEEAARLRQQRDRTPPTL